MKNKEVWSHYKDYTKDITEFSRKLALGGLVVCWFFKSKDAAFPPYVISALKNFILYFLSDLFQSLSGAILLKFWIRKEEKRQWNKTGSIDGEYLKPAWLDTPSFCFFVGKIIFLIMAFAYVGAELLLRSQ